MAARTAGFERARAGAVRRGMEFVYRTACEQENFYLYGHDYLFALFCMASNSHPADLRRMAREMGRERARHWRRENADVPPDCDANAVVHLVFGSDAADRFGVRDQSLKPKIRRAAVRFAARDYYSFDPAAESPPGDVPDECVCGTYNSRGRKRCRWCGKSLIATGRYGSWLDALIRTYIGERYGVRLGAKFEDAIKLLPEMRPYAEDGKNPEPYLAYAVTHVVYALSHYSLYNLSPRWLPYEFEYLRASVRPAVESEDPDLCGEVLDNLKSFGLTDSDALIREGEEFLLSQQNADGSWGDVDEEDIYNRYHPTWVALDGLRMCEPRPERLSFPRLMPLLLKML
jgi:hypothetical protein